jgi:shikimate dehydrogenase
VSGLDMLLHQAIAQVRIFVTGEEGGTLPREDEVVAAMRSALAL